MKNILLIPIVFLFTYSLNAQDSIPVHRTLDSVYLLSLINQHSIRPLPDVQGVFLFAGKKTESIDVAAQPADISNKTARQLFARVPGVFVYDMDGSGNQLNIAARGLDPHRGWEFNLRRDGSLTNSDMYGYPASHFSMPMESIGRIELVRGTGSLQYGAQFGGMLNYITKTGDTSRRFSLENITTAGSYNQLSSYLAAGGKMGKMRYYGYIYHKTRDGYRETENTRSAAHALMLEWMLTTKLTIKAEWTHSVYIYRLPGQLNDSMFAANPRQATRNRNYFSPDMHVPSITMEWKPGPQTFIKLNTSAVIGKRGSVLFDKPVTVKDSISTVTHDYANRQVDIDLFNSYTSELRVLHTYRTGNNQSVMAGGVQLMANNLHRRQMGKGTTGDDYTLSLVDPQWGRDMHFITHNMAVFLENNLRVSRTLRINAGFRAESGLTKMKGHIVYYPDDQIPLSISHRFPLLGTGFSYTPASRKEFYGGFAQAYRPMIFKDLIPGSAYEKVDPDIRDAKGYNAELGYRGNAGFLRWDISLYLLRYKNRFGTLAMTDTNGDLYTFRTNIGNSLTKGMECLLQGDWTINQQWFLSVFTSTAITDARYTEGQVKSGNTNKSINGNRVESTPVLISRNGFTAKQKNYSFSVLYSYTSSSYADAVNSTQLSVTGATGKVPAYGIWDVNGSLKISGQLECRATISNLLNKSYFTKRPLFYPGPGIWPSDGISTTFSLLIHL